MSAFRFDCVFYYVSDLDAAVRFYTTVLGFRLAWRDVVARFDLDGVLFELVPTNDLTLLSGRGNARLTLAVGDIQRALDELRANGLVTSEVHAVSNGRMASVHDPDGNEIVIWEYGDRPNPPVDR